MSEIELREWFEKYLAWMAEDLGDLAEKPELVLVEGLASEGANSKGKVFLRRSLLEGERRHLALTLAHEVAHCWWGPRFLPDRFFTESMAEAFGMRLVGQLLGTPAEDYLVQLARGRIFLLVSRGKQDHAWQENWELGAGALAVREWLGHFGPAGMDELAVLSRCGTLAELEQKLVQFEHTENAAWQALSLWRIAKSLPQPQVSNGHLLESKGLYLPCSVRLHSERGHRCIWWQGPMFLEKGERLSDLQTAPIIGGDLGSAGQAFLKAIAHTQGA